jgi:poly(3-hydroxybutyrate) depolymerase
VSQAFRLGSLIPALAIFGSACSGEEPQTPGSGGSQASGGSAGKTGGSSGTGGSAAATGGKTGSGGASGQGAGGKTGSGGQSATGGVTGGGRGGTGGQGAMAGATSGGNGGAGGPPLAGAGGSVAGSSMGGAGSGGKAGSGGAAGGGAAGSGGGLLPGNPPVLSAGCGKAPALTSGAKTIMVGGRNRDYTLRIPDNYDNNKPYRLIFGMHYIGANAAAVDVGSNILYPYYGIKGLDTEKTAIYIAPTAIDGRWNPSVDLPFVDAMVDAAKSGLCIDTTRIFTTGFSYGAIFSYTLGCERADTFRAVGTLAAAPILGCEDGTKPVAYLGISGMQDPTCTPAMGRQCRDTFVEANGCMVPSSVPEWTSGQNHVCYSYEGCDPNAPVRWCTGNFQHIAAHCDQCSPGQDDPVRTWFDDELWDFFTQF